jgi:hypothetical protein
VGETSLPEGKGVLYHGRGKFARGKAGFVFVLVDFTRIGKWHLPI